MRGGAVQRNVEAEIQDRFPQGSVQRVTLLKYGDDPAIEPGKIGVRVFIHASQAERAEALEAFHKTNEETIRQLARDLPTMLPGYSRLEFSDGDKSMFLMGFGAPDEKPGDLTPVMARLSPTDLETLDTLITAGIATSRAEAVRWALARIRERPAYAQLTERVRDINELKAQF